MITHLIILGGGIILSRSKSGQTFSTVETCFYGLKSLFENNPNIDLFNEGVLKDSKDKVFEIVSLTLVKQVDEFSCDVIAKDSKGFRSYRVLLEKSSKFQHFYRIVDVKGQEIVTTYQWKGNI